MDLKVDNNENELKYYLKHFKTHFKQFILNKIDLNELKSKSDSIMSNTYYGLSRHKNYILKEYVFPEDFKSRIDNNFEHLSENSDKYLNCFSDYLSIITQKFENRGEFFIESTKHQTIVDKIKLNFNSGNELLGNDFEDIFLELFNEFYSPLKSLYKVWRNH